MMSCCNTIKHRSLTVYFLDLWAQVRFDSDIEKYTFHTFVVSFTDLIGVEQQELK